MNTLWTPEEDDKLKQRVLVHGRDWDAIAADMPGRSPCACRNRVKWHKTYPMGMTTTTTRRIEHVGKVSGLTWTGYAS